jgi:hypothetical protein
MTAAVLLVLLAVVGVTVLRVHLNTPDGFDILGPGGTTPTHPSTG